MPIETKSEDTAESHERFRASLVLGGMVVGAVDHVSRGVCLQLERAVPIAHHRQEGFIKRRGR